MRRVHLTVAAALIGLATVTACTTGPTDRDGDLHRAPGAEGGSAVDDGAFPVTLQHAFGETIVEKEPKRVVTIGWTDTDHAVALGVVPVGATKLTWGGNDTGSSDWVDQAIEDLGATAPERFDDTDGAPVDAIAQLAPDLILATNSGLTESEYDKLSDLAPVVAYPENAWVTPWDDSLDLIGRALGRTSAAERLHEETEARLETVLRDNPQLEDTTFVFTALSPTDLSQINVYGEQDPRVKVVEDLGLETADVVENVVDADRFYGVVSAEQADTLDADLMLTYAEREADIEELADHPLIGQIPALAAGRVAWAQNETALGLALTNPTPLSIPVIIDEFVPKLVAAAK